LLKPAVQHLLASGEKSDRLSGLQAADTFGIPELEEEILTLVDGPDQAVMRSAMQALQRYASLRSQAAFQRVFEDRATSFDLRLAALNALVRQAAPPKDPQLERFMGALSSFEKYEFTNVLSASPQGGAFLVSLLERGQLKDDEIDNTTLVRLLNLELHSERLHALKRARDEGRQASFNQRFDAFLALARSGTGDPQKGRATFALLCLSCHRVGTEGVGFAPALDGAGHREDEALLTAILNPNAAVEHAYLTRRILKQDGTTVEGMVERHDDRGVTLRLMGGASVFVPQREVKGVQVLQGQSVMPEGLIDNLPHADVADLLAYVRTLK